eukprot:4214778-Alexandrium_andersonii.AAC.1
MRQFLGTVNWVREHCPKEAATCMKPLTRQLAKGASWPMPEEARRAMRALQAMAARLITLSVVDE